MLIGSRATVSDMEMHNARYGGEWLEQQVMSQLAGYWTEEVLHRYRGEITREGSLIKHETEFRLQLYVYTKDELDELIAHHIREATK